MRKNETNLFSIFLVKWKYLIKNVILGYIFIVCVLSRINQLIVLNITFR